MRIGKAIEHPRDACVLPSNMPTPGRTKVKYALGMAMQIAVLIASAIKAKQPNPGKETEKGYGAPFLAKATMPAHRTLTNRT